MRTADQSVWERLFVGAARWAAAHYGALAGHYTARESGLAAHYEWKAWLVLNAHYFGKGDGWAGTHDDCMDFLKLERGA